MDKTLEDIAKKFLNVEALDSEDSHECTAPALKNALQAAYEAGASSTKQAESVDGLQKLRQLAGIPHKGNYV